MTTMSRNMATVALLAEGVDRNVPGVCESFAVWVALLAEGVDRNLPIAVCLSFGAGRSPRGGRG